MKKVLSSKKFSYLWNQYRRFLKEKKYRYRRRDLGKMRVNIIAPDEKSGWIIYKFGKSVYDQLQKMGIEATLSDRFDPKADINHYFAPNNIGYSKMSKVDECTTFMITHVDTMLKLEQIRNLTEKGAIGVCMSLETRDKPVSSGIKRNRVCYINPAQDGQILPRKVLLGFTYMVHNDNRKRDDIVIDICKNINPKIFKFVIMGAGWDKIVAKITEMGFEVEYYSEFDKLKYNELMPKLDYYCYFGFDEGSMGYLDAVAAGVGTIVTPQGYHLDTECNITYPVKTLNDIVQALREIEKEREKAWRFVDSWTWEQYTKKHVEIWKYMLRSDSLENLLKNRGLYMDGIFSLLLDDLEDYVPLLEKITK